RWPRDWSSDVCSSDLSDGVPWCVRMLLRWEKIMNQDSGNPQGHEAENAAFRPNRPARQPGLAVQNRARKVPVKYVAAVRNGEKEGLAKVKAGVPAHG